MTSSDRVVIVTHRNHEKYLHDALGGARVKRVLMQPEDRGTAAGILLPASWIHLHDPGAVVAVFPSDHFVGDERLFAEHVAHVIEAVRQHPDWLVLLGAVPTDADPDYGWIETDEPLRSSPTAPINRVRRFWEKPSPMSARACLEQGWLWNTFVFVARAALLLDLASRLLPRLHEALSLVTPFWDTDRESWAIQQAYAVAPRSNFSRCLLELRPPELVVSRLPALVWSDWGRRSG